MNSLAIAQITSAVRATVERMRAEDADTDAGALLALVEQEAPEFGDMLAALCRAADEANAEDEALDRRIDALRKRQDRAVSRREEYRSLIFAALDAAGQRAWKSPEFTVSIAPGRPGVVITDESALPASFTRTKTEPDRALIRAALEQNLPVPGADLRNGAPSLTIRTK